jgi:YetF C-terminal domain
MTNAERLFEGVPKILVRNGQVRRLALIQERITRSELIEALRREGCTSLSRVRFAVLETDGTTTVGLAATDECGALRSPVLGAHRDARMRYSKGANCFPLVLRPLPCRCRDGDNVASGARTFPTVASENSIRRSGGGNRIRT